MLQSTQTKVHLVAVGTTVLVILAAVASTMFHGGVDTGFLLTLALAMGGLLLVTWQASQALKPLPALRALTLRLARGEIDVTNDVHGDDESGGLAEGLRGVTAYLREIASTTNAIARGELDNLVKSKGPDDALAASINEMTSTLRETARQARVIADGDYSSEIAERSERDELGIALRTMASALRVREQELRSQSWMKSGVAKMNELVLGQDALTTLVNSALTAVANHLDAKVGTFYITDREGGETSLRMLGSYAYAQRKNLANRFKLGEGLVGQAALEQKQIHLTSVPDDYIRIVSGVGEAAPRHICVTPILFKGDLRGVIEIGTLGPLGSPELLYLEQVVTVIGVALEIAHKQALVRTQQEEMRVQQVEIEQTNAELEAQMSRVKESEDRLRDQQRSLELTNTELHDKNRQLERQQEENNAARARLAAQAEELALGSKYKSEFLANMSHELRTPLNSLLLLARSLRDNHERNLTPEQQESASVIFESGNDLLNLINEILDLAKIEAGRMELKVQEIELADVARSLEQQFGHMARSQELSLEIVTAHGGPAALSTDPQRLGQVLKNLVGNALKFTEKGSVRITFTLCPPGVDLSRSGLAADNALAIHVADTGIGIPVDKQRLVFEAFQQADSGDRRRFGGTGLGLSISRELAALLGGEIQLSSTPGVGSTFTLFIPLQRATSATSTAAATSSGHPAKEAQAPLRPSLEASTLAVARVRSAPPMPTPNIDDDSQGLEDSDRVILIIEDDARFAQTLVGEVRRRGFKCLVGLDGARGVALARSYRPHGVILDLHLPDTTGWAVLSTLKEDLDTRHIPIHIVSVDDASIEGLRLGAIGHASKPLRTEDIDAVLSRLDRSSATAPKRVLVVEDDPIMRKETVRIIGNGNVHTDQVGTGREALAALRQVEYALLVLDLGLPDMQGMQLLETATAEHLTLPPVIVYTTRDLTMDEQLALRVYAEAIIIKDVRSQERLIDEVSLFLHRVVNDLPAEKRQVLRHLHRSDEPLRGKKILIVEDDMRTMFAMAKLLASHGVAPIKAGNGEQALAHLEAHPDIDLVLMDMMMPVMDGYEAMRRAREQPRLANVPIIALTAKAMREDRQKCMEAGATDYLSKPVDPERLVSLLRVWLCR